MALSMERKTVLVFLPEFLFEQREHDFERQRLYAFDKFLERGRAVGACKQLTDFHGDAARIGKQPGKRLFGEQAFGLVLSALEFFSRQPDTEKLQGAFCCVEDSHVN